MVYYINIYAKDKTGKIEWLWGGDSSILPRVGDTIMFCHKYKVVEVVLYWLVGGAVTIYVEKEE
jgi:hypothetical protein